ncbi:NADP-dependent oxidoreductase domain-containing protein, partial [Lipomyces tetrasporus]
MSVSSQYANLGKSGLKTSKVIVGCMSFGDKRWFDWVIEDEEQAFAVLKKCYDSGIRTFDTANAYSNGGSEILLGKFLK